MGVQLHGITKLDRTWHVGTGHLIAGQSAGLVVLVIVGHGVVLVTGGSVTTLVMTRVCVVLVDVEVGRGTMVVRRVLDVVGHASCEVRNSMPHP